MKPQIHVSMPMNLYLKLKKEKQRTKKPVSKIVQEALKEYFKN